MVDILHAAWGTETDDVASTSTHPKDKDWGIHKDTRNDSHTLVYNDAGVMRRLPQGNPWQFLGIIDTTIQYDVSDGNNAVLLEVLVDSSNTLQAPQGAVDGDEGQIFVSGGSSVSYPTFASEWDLGEDSGGTPISLPTLPSVNTKGIILSWVKRGPVFHIIASENRVWDATLQSPGYALSGGMLIYDPAVPDTIRSGVINDLGSGANDGSLPGINQDPYVSDVPSGSWNSRATYLNGADYYIDIDSFATSGEFSFSGWFKYAGSGALFLMGQDASAANYIQVVSATAIQIEMDSNDVDFTVSSMDAGWHHIAITRDSSDDVRVFVDGAEATSGEVNETSEITLDVFGNSNASLSEVTLSDWRYYTSEISSDNRSYLQTFGELGSAPGSEVNLWPLTGAPVDGNTCIYWYDLVSGRPAYQLTAANRPEYDETNNCFIYDGVSVDWLIDDASELSVGDGSSSDGPITFVGWGNPTDATGFWMLSKSDASNREYLYGFNSSDKTQCSMCDNTSSVFIRSVSDVAITESVWTALLVEYDGSSVESGISIEEDGSAVAQTKDENGGYAAMHDTATPVSIGSLTGASTTYANGSIGLVALFNRELSAVEKSFLTTYGNQYWS